MLVEIWSDVVCPWCAIGKARFARAVERFEHAGEVTVAYRAFELDPNAPPRRRGSATENLAAKYGMSIEEARRAHDHLAEVAAVDGLEFHFDRARPGNTFDAHRLLHHAADRGRQAELLDVLMEGYFGSGLAVGDPEELAGAATRAGLDAAEVTAVLAGDDHAETVRADQARARDLGVTGVPFFLIEGRYAIPGAQSIERFVMGLERAWDRITAA